MAYIAAVGTKPAVQYWIIGAVCGPVVLIALVCVIFMWRWKVGGPNKKINPEDGVELQVEKGPVVCTIPVMTSRSLF